MEVLREAASDSRKCVRVVAAVIRDRRNHGNRIFATARGYGEYKGQWEFPGGKIEPGETPQEALAREIREELATTISVGELIRTIEYDYPKFHLSMDCFWAEVAEGDLELREAEAAKWLAPDELGTVDWLPADRELIDEIYARCIVEEDRTMMSKGIAHAAFNVKDMETTIAFYENTLGFRRAFDIPRPENGEPWIVYLYGGGGQFVELFYGATKDNPYRDENVGFFHICVAVDDIHEAWRKILETGAPQDDAPKQGADFNWQCWTHDPDGIKIELMQLDEKSPQMQFIREAEKKG